MHKGQKIKELLKAKKIKQVDFANDLGVSKQRVFQLLKEDDISIDRLMRIAKIIGVPLRELIDKEERDILGDKEGGGNNEVRFLRDQLRVYEIALNASETTIKAQKELIDALKKANEEHGNCKKQTGTSG